MTDNKWTHIYPSDMPAKLGFRIDQPGQMGIPEPKESCREEPPYKRFPPKLLEELNRMFEQHWERKVQIVVPVNEQLPPELGDDGVPMSPGPILRTELGKAALDAAFTGTGIIKIQEDGLEVIPPEKVQIEPDGEQE